MIKILVLTIAVASCDKQGTSEPVATGDETEKTGDRRGKKASDDDPCAPASLGVPDAKPATPFTPPAECAYQGSKTWVASDDDASEAFGCDAAKLGIDFAKEAIVVSSGSFSPAQTGSWAIDDGRAITIVSRFRTPCKDDPVPMPTPFTTIFRVPAGERTFTEKSCTVKEKC